MTSLSGATKIRMQMSGTTADLDDGDSADGDAIGGLQRSGLLGGGETPPRPITTTASRRQHRAIIGIAAGFTVLVSVCVLAGLLAWKSNETNQRILQTLDIRRTASEAMERLLQAESSQRGFLLIHDTSFLPLFEDAEADFRRMIALMHRQTGANPMQSEQVAAFEKLANLKLQELSQAITLQRAGHTEDALTLMRTGLGQQTMERARQVQMQMMEGLNREIQATAPAQTLLTKVLLATIGVAAIYVIGLSRLVLRDTKRNLQFLQAREQALRQLAATLEDRVKRRTHSLSEANQRFDAALRAARVTVFTQDLDLHFTWISKSEFGLTPDDIVGRTNTDAVPAESLEPVQRIKRRVLETGEPGHGEVRIAHDGHDKWYEISIHPLRDDAGRISGLIGGSVEITERKEQEARIRLLMRELTHRSKNLLAVIQAIMRQTAANSLSTDDFQKRFSERLHSLSGSHDLLVQEDWNGASLGDLVRSQLGHYSDLVGSQIALEGPPIQIRPDAAQHIGMALHELATNAAKYGALSVPDGKVHISWTVPPAQTPESHCTLDWVESNGPPVTPPTRRGFGRVVIERTVARAVGGEVHIIYPVTGVRWQLVFPRSALADPAFAQDNPRQSPARPRETGH